jgi:hypothetical protein
MEYRHGAGAVIQSRAGVIRDENVASYCHSQWERSLTSANLKTYSQREDTMDAALGTGKQEPMVQSELGNLRRQTERAHELVSKLSERLAPVLKPSCPTPGGTASEAKEQQHCPLRDIICTEMISVRTLNERMTDLIERLEV